MYLFKMFTYEASFEEVVFVEAAAVHHLHGGAHAAHPRARVVLQRLDSGDVDS